MDEPAPPAADPADVLPQAQERSIDLGVLPSEPAWVRGDADALLILLRNLLENAIKYTPAQGQVDVTVHIQDKVPSLTVEDSGPGIRQAERARVFERFFRSAQADAAGSGLGLAIARTIAERHHATLHLDQSPRLGGLKVELRFQPAE